MCMCDYAIKCFGILKPYLTGMQADFEVCFYACVYVYVCFEVKLS